MTFLRNLTLAPLTRGVAVTARPSKAGRAVTGNVRPSQPPCPGSHRPASVPLTDAGHSSFEDQCSSLLLEVARGVLREAALAAELRAAEAEIRVLRAELGIPTIRGAA